MKPWQIVLILFLLGSTLYAVERIQRGKAERRAEAAEQAVDSLKRLERAADTVYLARVDTLRQWRTRWDTVKTAARFDTVRVPVETILLVADSTISACEAVVESCEVRVGLARERADSAEKAAGYWRKLAKGPFIRPAIEFTMTPELDPMAAFDLTLGRGRLKVLGRVEAVEPVESCAYVPSQEASVCSTGNPLTYRVGVRYSF